MDSTLTDLLRRREQDATRRRLGNTIGSTLLHVGLGAFFLLGPALVAREAEPFQYTKVQIVPLRALGVPDPEPVRAPTPKPAPEPAETPPAPEPEPREEDKPRVPSPDATPRTRTADRDRSESPASGSSAQPDRPAQRRGTPDGSPLGLAPFGSNQSGFDDPDFQYSYYTDLLLAIIGTNYLRPAIAVEVELVVHFRITRDGTIENIEIVQPSGYASFDQAGLSAVSSSSLPPLPVSYPHDSLGVSLIIR